MKTHAEFLLPQEDIALLAEVETQLVLIKNENDSETCHTVAEKIAAAKPQLKAVHGYLLLRDSIGTNHTWTHSWLKTPSGNIIDPYPWATVGGPVLLDMR